MSVVCGRCSHGSGRDRVQVRHPLEEVRVCTGPRRVSVPVVTSVVPFVAPAPVVAPAPASGEVWALGEKIFKVVPARNSERLFAHELVSPVEPGADLVWVYRGLASRVLAGGAPAAAEVVARIGRVVGRCVFCSRLLTDDKAGRSVEVGYGPKCAADRGLPWG
jgi:hypothetical protein